MPSNCGEFEQLLALYVEEDLAASDRARVETHLNECLSCRDLAADLKESQEVFKSIRRDVPDATALSSLRERVLAEVTGLEALTWFERIIFGGLRRKAALAGIALVLGTSGALWFARSPGIVPDPPVVAAVKDPAPPPSPLPVPEPQPEVVAVVSTPPVSSRALHTNPLATPQPPAEEPKQVAIKFLTDDPNIIIYWLVDEKGE